jgi:hypothetical protein
MSSAPFRTSGSIEPLEARIAPATFVVTTTADNGPGSLRQAILDANSTEEPDQITFEIPGEGVQTIRPVTELPWITFPVTIDGRTQPGFVDVPLIELDGSLIPEPDLYRERFASGLTIHGSSASISVIRDLWIHDFHDAQVRISGTASFNLVIGCYLGFGPDLTPGKMEKAVIWILSGSGNRVGGAAADEGNVIGGSETGILIDPRPIPPNSPGEQDGGLTGTKIHGNLIGLTPDGLSPLPNNYGIRNIHGMNTTIGGDGILKYGARNVIAANTIAGISFEGEHTSQTASQRSFIFNNYIGTDVHGEKAVGFQGTGISIDGASGILIGTELKSVNTRLANVISGNSGTGLLIKDAGLKSRASDYQYEARIAVHYNFIGTNWSGSEPIGNGGDGMRLETTKSDVGSLHLIDNTLSANGRAGLAIAGGSPAVEAPMYIVGNQIGTDKTGTKSMGNEIGVLLDHAGTVQIGAWLPNAYVWDLVNIISGNHGNGIQIIHESAESSEAALLESVRTKESWVMVVMAFTRPELSDPWLSAPLGLTAGQGTSLLVMLETVFFSRVIPQRFH